MSRRLLTLLYVALLAVPLWGEPADDLFADSVLLCYEKAYGLNEAREYLKAYRQVLRAEQLVDASLSAGGIGAAALNDYEFLRIYWPVKKSKAEIAYMLGIHTDMEAVEKELCRALEERQWEHGEEESMRSTVDVLRADLAKIAGCRHYLSAQYNASEAALKEALRLTPRYGREDFICKVRDDLAQLYYRQEAYGKALAQLDTILASPLYADAAARSKESEQNIRLIKSQRALCMARMGRYGEALTLMDSIVAAYNLLPEKRLYAEALRKKAKILMLQYDATGSYNPAAKRCYQEYLALSRTYIDTHFVNMSEAEREQYWMAEQPFVTDCYRLEEQAPELLYDVALYSKAVLLQMGRDFKAGMTLAERKRALASVRVTWQQVRNQLPANGCAIEFILYEKRGHNHMGALVMQKSSKAPRFIDIAPVERFSNHRVGGMWTISEVLADTQTREKINALYGDSTLCRMIWNDQLTAAIGSSSEVFFAPDGLFHQIGIEYLTPQPMADRHFYRLTTTRMLLQPKGKRIATDRMMLCGGVEYGFSLSDQERGNDEQTYALLSAMGMYLQPLPGSAVEIDSIRSVRSKHTGDVVLRADSVTEKRLQALLGRYPLCHISTHGLFVEAEQIGTDLRPSATDRQLSKSCLFLSGSEHNLRQQGYDASCHDGVLSARELAKMELGQVDLTVLSACMSGLGYITPDGVYGLQRGLKTAGVRAIISTLWSVDDEATCLFTTQLYRHLEQGEGLHEAFWKAREALKRYEKSYGTATTPQEGAAASFTQRRRITIPKYNKPYFYNAFILIDGAEL